MKQIIEYFKNSEPIEFIVYAIIACLVIRYCYDILQGKD